MSSISIITFVSISLLVLIIAAVIIIAITGNFKIGLRLRQELAQRVKYLRLDKMLSKRNIKREHYLHTESVTNIENQIRSCESCSVTKKCDEVLKDGSPADLSFCPNDEILESIAKKSHSITK
jgi:hypothetical protein